VGIFIVTYLIARHSFVAGATAISASFARARIIVLVAGRKKKHSCQQKQSYYFSGFPHKWNLVSPETGNDSKLKLFYKRISMQRVQNGKN
jgi:hypothetical protein